jgi:hypothetical protein
MAIVKTLNLIRIFAFDTLMCAASGTNLKKYMMRKHGWDSVTFENMRSTYLVGLSMLSKVEELSEVPDIDEMSNLPVPGSVAQVKKGYLYEILYKWGKGQKRGFGRVTPTHLETGSDDTMYILCEEGGIGFEHVEDVEIVREICRIDRKI